MEKMYLGKTNVLMWNNVLVENNVLLENNVLMEKNVLMDNNVSIETNMYLWKILNLWKIKYFSSQHLRGTMEKNKITSVLIPALLVLYHVFNEERQSWNETHSALSTFLRDGF